MLYQNTIEMLDWRHAGRAYGSYRRRLGQLCTTDILILDNFGLQALSASAVMDRLVHRAIKLVLLKARATDSGTFTMSTESLTVDTQPM